MNGWMYRWMIQYICLVFQEEISKHFLFDLKLQNKVCLQQI